jgi:hypothetical protein
MAVDVQIVKAWEPLNNANFLCQPNRK